MLIITGVLLWLTNKYIPIEQENKKLLNVVVAIPIIILMLAIFFGGWNGI
jgi:hypothetical protein